MWFPSFVGDARVRFAVVIAGIVPAFALTFLVVGRYKDQRTALARDWSQRGERDMPASPRAAVSDFETALAYGPDDPADRLRLAEALIASGEPTEARAHLLTLWAEEPGDGRLNLDLARLAAGAGDISEATRYYHAAIDGAWDEGATDARRGARLELAKLLLRSGEPVRAQAELIALIDDLPPDPALLTEVGTLLITAGADTRAVPLFERALALDPRDGPAARLEGEVQFRGRRYQAAHNLLDAARRAGASLSPDDQSMLASSPRIPELDPFAEGLLGRERLDRAVADLAIARTRIARCESSAGQSAASALLADLSHRADGFYKLPRARLARDPDQIANIVTVVGEIEALPAQQCGPDTPDDHALQLIARDHRSPVR